MFFVPNVSSFEWQVNNFGDSFAGNSTATQLTADASANTKGTTAQLLVGLAEDCYAMAIYVSAGSTDTVIRRMMIDLMIDPAAGVGGSGSSWSVSINNIFANANSAAIGTLAHNFYFPLFIKAGTAIGARTQDVVGAATCRVGIRIFGKPTRPELLAVGNRVQTIGANTGTTAGASFTPGSSGSLGSWSASVGTTDRDSWFWQMGVGSNDASMTVQTYRMDVSAVSAGGVMCLRSLNYQVASSLEVSGKSAGGEGDMVQEVPSGSNVYVRGMATGTPDTGFTAVVYAVS